MRFEGRAWRDGDHWLIEVPALRAMTQGHSEHDARDMLKDLIETMAGAPELEVTVYPQVDGKLEVGANDVTALVALMLRRQREKRGISLTEAASLLHQKSRNAYARYEQGKAVPTVEKLDELLRAIAPDQPWVWRLG